ncbi:glycoside hydrolase family 15 protein [Nakamurella multipartita]|jgi:GH15 family glucan-1,4-alpha-glucosidase|uniref:Trehalase n=1 Tax=Nakamurella multipartita (strain ATCC 700099 / DSM 44233 / CIP 104796 / JCM 9543 / NBRC 105858 / Y-104) TaxID=479431 RepID=C8XCB3_NAKMY|nr:glycoside hydrolase family 15 protein [Nakamurella multipartita]ACV81507.1 glycoside hydrolase 15-related [Nakamurella multipartita DSM 44233]
MTDTDDAAGSAPAADGLDASFDAVMASPTGGVHVLDPPNTAAASDAPLHPVHHSSGNFPSIGDYAFLSDCESNCLIAPSGAVEWMCVPRPDSPSVFTALLDRAGGSFRVAPFGVAVPAARRYLPGTLVLETTWQTPTGWLIVRDALIMAEWHNTDQRSKTHRRSPTDYDAAHVLLRTIKCVYGTVDLQMSCEPVFDYARKGAKWTYPKPDYSEVVATAKGQPTLRLASSLRIGLEGRTAQARTKMKRDEVHYVALAFSDLPPPVDTAQAEDWMWRTGEYWRQWLSQGTFPDHPWRAYLQSSALALKGLSYAPTGALLAAATTSLPETPGGERNWDYRFTWIRDSTFALWGLYTLGFDREANDFFYFIHDVCRDNPNDLQIMYGVGGERHLEEGTLDHLTGYDDARPVRIGNGAYNQQQHDVWGALLDSIYLHTRSREQMPEELWPIVIAQVEQAAAHWRAPDRGIWEVRGEPQHFTASKIMCWVALDRGVRLARLHDSHEIADKWEKIADEIHADVLANGVDERGVLVQRYGADALDASLLLAPLVRFLPPDDPRIKATVLAIADELTHDGLVLRYRVEETDDGLSGEEGTFTICSFWLVSALVEIGEEERAHALCERLLAHASILGLYAEELDSVSGRHLGNFPQAFTHLALINAVTHVIRAEERRRSHGFAPANRQA